MNSSPAGDDAQLSVEVELAGHVGIVSFVNGRSNYISYEAVELLADTFEQLAASGTRAVVLRSSSRHFCGGANFAGRRGVPGGRHIFDVVPRLFHQSVPVVAAVHGAAIGAGLGLALIADFRVAAASAYFCGNFTRLGLSPGLAVTLTLPHVVGAQRAAEMLYTGRRVGAGEALELGLCDRVAPDADLLSEATSLAQAIAESSPLAVLATRKILRADLVSRVQDALQHELEAQRPLYETEDFREGIAAWRDRRLPDFHGA